MASDNSLNPGEIDHYLAHKTPIERELKRLFRTSKKLTLFDIGACEGEESIRYARLFPQAKIFTFEPLPGNQELVKQNFERYGTKTAELVPVALSDSNGTAEFHVSSGRPPESSDNEEWNYGNKSSSLLPPAKSDPMFGWLEFKEKIPVVTQTLDSFLQERKISRVDFIHMDVQGAEHLVLKGAAQNLSHTTAVWLEVTEQELYAGQKLKTETESLMHAAGFTLALDLPREIEGDQLYINRRCIRLWPYLIARKFLSFWRRDNQK